MPAKKKCKYGRKADGTCRKKPGPKKSITKRRTYKKKTTTKRKNGSCVYGRTAAGKCRKSPFKARSRPRTIYGHGRHRIGQSVGSQFGGREAVYDAPMGPVRRSGHY